LAEVPIPLNSPDTLLVKNIASLVSLGTERSVIELGQKSLLGKAKARPDLVKRFLEKSKKEGFFKTFQEALGRLDIPTPLGYSSAGVVIKVGNNINKFAPGDRVACIGAGYASHAEYVRVPENLCCKIPDGLSSEEASFGMLGIIALHGIRCAKLTFGETVAVIGLGLLGLLTVQILKAYGCRVIGTDIDPNKLELVSKLGIDATASGEAFKKACKLFTEGLGVDAVILTVATKSDEPLNIAIDAVRYGGRIVIVGVTDIHPQRNEMWHKEVEIIVSKAGGPGTFDPFYENKGIDYPIAFVRWTENRNLEEFLRLVAHSKVDVKSLISHRFKIEEAEKVYKDIIDNRGGPYIGVVLEYPRDEVRSEVIGHRIKTLKPVSYQSSAISSINLGVIGAGLFGKALLLPALKKVSGVKFHTISTSSGANAYHTAKKYGFESYTTDYKEILTNKEINAVVILTPHSTHAKMVTEALQATKHVFVEKPLCINESELNEIIKAYNSELRTRNSDLILMVGYNRRFSPHAAKIVEYLSKRRDPMVINYRVNVGFVPANHWVHSEEEGGSRIIGEICHFVDFMQFLTRSNPVRVFAERVSGNNRSTLNSDNVVIALKFEDGSVGNIIYSASGDKAFSREQVEIFCEGATIVSTDFKKTSFYKDGKCKTYKTMNQEMGYKEELAHFVDAIIGKSSPCISYGEIFSSTQAVFSINSSLEKNSPVAVILPL
jgi:predicted dehydrogenase/threonine dehydrogenase-like Zn-dependent dehydrogenase